MPRASITDTDLINKIQELTNIGLSKSEVGKQLGLTKNQVSGLMHRWKKMCDPDDAPTISIKELALEEYGRYLKIVDPPCPEVIPEEGLSLLELPTDSCRFSVSTREDGVHLFCGHKAWDKSPYCEKHHRKVYTPTFPFHRKKVA